MSKVVVKLRDSLTNTSMLASILLLLGMLTWIQAFPNVKTVRSGVMWHFPTESKGLSALSAMVLTNQKITENLNGAAKQTKKQILLDLKQRKENLAHIYLNVWTVGETIKLTQICVCSRDIDSTRSDNRRNIPRSMKTGSSQFALQEAVNLNNDYKRPQNLLAKHLKELINC